LEPRSGAASRDDLVIVTARMRTGSTVLWNLFRNMTGVTAYYEPFNEKRWFLPREQKDQIDPTHRNVVCS
jgi:hypothetical protein